MNADRNRAGLNMARGRFPMSEIDEGKLYELDQLLNDPEVPMQAARVWELLDEISARNTRSD